MARLPYHDDPTAIAIRDAHGPSVSVYRAQALIGGEGSPCSEDTVRRLVTSGMLRRLAGGAICRESLIVYLLAGVPAALNVSEAVAPAGRANGSRASRGAVKP